MNYFSRYSQHTILVIHPSQSLSPGSQVFKVTKKSIIPDGSPAGYSDRHQNQLREV